MAKIAGFKPVKNNRGEITHVVLSMKEHAEYLENLLDLADMRKADKGDTIPWPDAKKQLERTIKSRTKK
ncbi:MAG: hypothetical protein ABIN67_20120 [Ferruginibacter sp.]